MKILDFKSFINESLLLEKSSLSILGVPSEVMKPIQKDFALSSDVEWIKIKSIRTIKNKLEKGEKTLFLLVSLKTIKVVACYPTIKGTEFIIDTYNYEDSGWGGSYNKVERQYTSSDETISNLDEKGNRYMLNGDFSIHKQNKRLLDKKEVDYKSFRETFKKEFLKRFDIILKKITGANFKQAKGKVDEKAKRIALENKYLMQSLDNPLQGNNGLSIIDEFLLKFEEAYSEYFDEHTDIQELTEHFTRERVMTLLMYYIYKGKIIN